MACLARPILDLPTCASRAYAVHSTALRSRKIPTKACYLLYFVFPLPKDAGVGVNFVRTSSRAAARMRTYNMKLPTGNNGHQTDFHRSALVSLSHRHTLCWRVEPYMCSRVRPPIDVGVWCDTRERGGAVKVHPAGREVRAGTQETRVSTVSRVWPTAKCFHGTPRVQHHCSSSKPTWRAYQNLLSTFFAQQRLLPETTERSQNQNSGTQKKRGSVKCTIIWWIPTKK